MTDRRKLTTLDKLNIMVRQARCTSCGKPLGRLTDCEFDHQHQLAMGGADTLDNLFAKHVDCHKAKTKADAQARAKVRHIAKKAQRFQAMPSGVDVGNEVAPARVKRSRPMQSRGFDKTKSRKFNAQVEKRT